MEEQFLTQLQGILMEINSRLEKLESYTFQVEDDRIQTLEHTLNDVVIASLKEANDEYEYHMALEAFKEMHPEVAGLQEPLSALYGEDYDVYKDLYDTMQGHTGDEGFDEKAYVDGQIADVNNRLAALKRPGVEEEVVVEEKEPEGDEEEEWSEEQLAKEFAATK